MKNALILSAIAATALYGQTVTLTASPSSVSLTYQMGAKLPAAAKIAVRASKGSPTFTTAGDPTACG